MIDVLALMEGEMFYPTKHESVGIAMLLDVIDMSLVDVQHIARPHDDVADGKIQREEIAEAGAVEERGHGNVVVAIAFGEDFVVALPVLGDEHGSYHGDVQLIADYERPLPQTELHDGSYGS